MSQDDDRIAHETERAALAELLVTEGAVREAALQRIVAMATRLFEIPAAVVTIVGTDHSWFETSIGISRRISPREQTFGAAVIQSADVLVVPDANADPRFCDLPSVREGRIVFYAGAPLVSAFGLRIGALGLIDTKVRSALSSLEQQILKDFADLAMNEIESRRARLLNDILQGIAHSVSAALVCTDEAGTILYQNPAAEQLLGYEPRELFGRDVATIVPQRFVAAHRTGMARVAAGTPSKLAGRMFESVVIRKDGVEVPIDLGLTVWRDASGLKFNAAMRDITERKQREERLSRLAYYDALTGLSRAGGFTRKLASHLDRGGAATMLIAEIDGLRGVKRRARLRDRRCADPGDRDPHLRRDPARRQARALERPRLRRRAA